MRAAAVELLNRKRPEEGLCRWKAPWAGRSMHLSRGCGEHGLRPGLVMTHAKAKRGHGARRQGCPWHCFRTTHAGKTTPSARHESGVRHGGLAVVKRHAPWWAARATESETTQESPRHGCSFFECKWQTSIRRILMLTCGGRKIVSELISSDATSGPAR